MPGEGRWIELAEGDRFAGYRIERILGRGGMGVLYLAIEPGLERRVALKLIAPEAAAEEVFARRFAEESRIAASIEHPNVVPIYAAGEQDGVPFIAMRYVAGSDLGKHLGREGRLEPAAAAALIAQVGSGLDAIHAAGLVHRDVKPANVLLDETAAVDHAYITDFGVARNVATESGLTETGRFVGTLDYVAPEQISGGAVDARTDVYALGCLLCKLLTGEVPYPREGEAARLYAHLNDPPPAPSLRATAVPMALDDVVIRSLSKQPEDRYPSAGDLGRAAVAALSGAAPELPERTVATGAAATGTAETIAPQPSDAATRRLPPERSRGSRPLVALAGLAAVVAAAAAVLLTAGGDDRNPGSGDGGATRAELIAKADAICRQSKDRYLEVRDLESERSADPSYAEALVRNARLRIRGLQGLTPPRQLATPYGEYVEAQERVYATDREALAAAREGSRVGVEAARDRRDAEDRLRTRLAREIGFTVCSTPQR
ncbi:MAG: serine/threonine-protein kinase [Solirubrobacterales bacterium]